MYLKRLIVGGLDKVYEIGRVFRNEGIDQDHNPEFTLLESLRSICRLQCGDGDGGVAGVVPWPRDVHGSMQIAMGDDIIDFTPPWPRLSLREELLRRSGIDIEDYPDAESLTLIAWDLGLEPAPREARGRLIDKMLSVYVEPRLIQPSFLIDYPRGYVAAGQGASR